MILCIYCWGAISLAFATFPAEERVAFPAPPRQNLKAVIICTFQWEAWEMPNRLRSLLNVSHDSQFKHDCLLFPLFRRVCVLKFLNERVRRRLFFRLLSLLVQQINNTNTNHAVLLMQSMLVPVGVRVPRS